MALSLSLTLKERLVMVLMLFLTVFERLLMLIILLSIIESRAFTLNESFLLLL